MLKEKHVHRVRKNTESAIMKDSRKEAEEMARDRTW